MLKSDTLIHAKLNQTTEELEYYASVHAIAIHTFIKLKKKHTFIVHHCKGEGVRFSQDDWLVITGEL